MDNRRPYAKGSHSEDGGLTEAIAPAHGDNAKDACRQIGEANLELKGIAGRPPDRLRDRVRNEEVTEESPNSASCDTDPKQIQQEDFDPALAGPATPVQPEMTGSDDHRQDGEAEHTDRNTVHAFPSSRNIAAVTNRLPTLLAAGDPAVTADFAFPAAPRAHPAELDVSVQWLPVL